jgi:hypothetical protein
MSRHAQRTHFDSTESGINKTINKVLVIAKR